MKLVLRADDYGYTMIHNLGTIKAIREGIVTHVDMMFDTPGTIDGFERLKEFPWISVGWHPHFWGTPISDPKLIPSMVNEEGKFKFRKNQKLKETVVYEEALLECRAQIELCIRHLGRVPDVANIMSDSTFERARKQICEEYGIVYNVMTKYDTTSDRMTYPLDKHKHLNIFMATQQKTAYAPVESKDKNDRINYDPVQYFIDDVDHLFDHEINISAWHPGFLDDYVLSESSYTDARPKDVEALCSPVLKQWVIDKQVELITFRDAIYGTHDYQNHLRLNHSSLWIKK